MRSPDSRRAEGENTNDDDVLIAGAGIGGLAAALSMHAQDIPVSVIESAGELRPLGVGINLLPRAVGALHELGLAEHLERLGVGITTSVYSDHHGTIQLREPRGLAGGYQWPQYSIHRGHLQMMLLEAVHDRLEFDAVTTGHRVTGFTQDRDAVQIHTPPPRQRRGVRPSRRALARGG